MKKSEAKAVPAETQLEFIQDVGSFQFWNGDEYTGGYLAAKKSRNIVREGEGVYRTGDDHIYSGIWEEDGMKDNVHIIFPDGTAFMGCVENMVLQGPGLYRLVDNVDIEGNFVGNRLLGRTYLKDPTQHSWRGICNIEERYVTLKPLHPFWQSVLKSSSQDEHESPQEEQNNNV